VLEILLLAAAGAAGFLFGRRTAGEGKDHVPMILLMARATRNERSAVLALPSVQVPKVPAGVPQPPVPGLFSDDEKRAILAEVKAKQDELLAAGETLRPDQRVSADELALKPALQAPSRPSMQGIPISYFFS
jgi:hypothetical protein